MHGGNSTDNCGATETSPATSFTCSDAPSATVVLTATDAAGNSSTVNCTVNIVDNEAPAALCQNLTVQLDANGSISITPQDVDNGSSDACGIQSRSLSQTDFGCTDTGGNTVTLTVENNNGNSSTCNATVTVEDNVAPTALCQNLTVQLDASGSGNTTAAAVDNGSSDACGIQSRSLSQTDFGCADTGGNTVTLTVEDNNGNSSTCTATVTVQDNVAPTALCQNLTVQLDASGSGSTTAAAVENGSSDACGIQSRSLSQTDFGCADVGANTVILTVTDVNGNESTCSATITVEDNVAPTALCQDVTVQLDASGNGSTTAAAVDNGSSDACGVQSRSLSQTSFGCADVGANTETLTITDVNGNVSTCSATITVEDNIAPTAACLNTTVEIQPDGFYDLQESDVYDAANSSDNCAISTVNFPGAVFTCADVGLAFPVTVTAGDPSGNTSTCTATVAVSIGDALLALFENTDIGQSSSGNELRLPTLR